MEGLIGLQTNVYFVRHAHSIYTPDEMERPLSEYGLKAVRIVTELLKNEAIDVVYSSPYKRAIQTVEEIARYYKKDIKVVDELKERRLSSKPVEDFEAAITKVWEDFDFAWEGGESSRQAQKRGVVAILNLLENNQGKNIVMGTHGNIMVLMMNHFDSQYHMDFWEKLEMPDIYKLTFNKKELIEVRRIWDEPI